MVPLEHKVKYVYNSNRLDGVHVPYEVALALAKAPPDPLASSAEVAALDGKSYDPGVVTSHLGAVTFVERLACEVRPYTDADIREMHRRLMDGVILSGGEFRECTLRLRAVPPVAPDDIPRRLKRVLDIANVGVQRLEAASASSPASKTGGAEILAWQVHHEFLYVHPFIEGNGRMARLMLNLVRMRAGASLEVIPFAEHERYLRSVIDYGKKLATAV